jgi:hypothetical protein
MSSFKKLSKADVTTAPYAANKQWSFSYNTAPNNYIVFYRGKKETFSITGSTTTNGQYQSNIFSGINHLFYQSYSGSLLNTGSLMFNAETYQSASQQRPTGAYFDYNINPLFIDNFPTASNSTINVLSVSKEIYGSKILPNSFRITASIGTITDDGYGNLYHGTTQVGNIFYSHGLAVITHQSSSYTGLLTGSFATASIYFQNEHIIYENEVRCIVRESEYNLSYNPTLVTGSYSGGVIKGFATSASFNPYVTTIGLYNDENELLMVAKLAKPIMISSNTDMTFIVKYDT